MMRLWGVMCPRWTQFEIDGHNMGRDSTIDGHNLGQDSTIDGHNLGRDRFRTWRRTSKDHAVVGGDVP